MTCHFRTGQTFTTSLFLWIHVVKNYFHYFHQLTIIKYNFKTDLTDQTYRAASYFFLWVAPAQLGSAYLKEHFWLYIKSIYICYIKFKSFYLEQAKSIPKYLPSLTCRLQLWFFLKVSILTPSYSPPLNFMLVCVCVFIIWYI